MPGLKLAVMGVTAVFAIAGCSGHSDTVEGQPLTSDAPTGPSIEISAAPSPGSGGDSEVTGSRLTGPKVSLFQCAVQTDGATTIDAFEACDLTRARVVDLDATGGLRAKFRLEPVIGLGQRHENDCLAQPCVLAVAGPNDEVLAASEIDWPDDVVLPPAPRLTISDVVFDGRGVGTAKVSGKSYLPDQGVRLTQCPAAGGGSSPDVVAGECRYDASTVFTADANGSFSGSVELTATLSTSAGESIDCVAAPASCAIADPWPRRGRMSRVLLG